MEVCQRVVVLKKRLVVMTLMNGDEVVVVLKTIGLVEDGSFETVVGLIGGVVVEINLSENVELALILEAIEVCCVSLECVDLEMDVSAEVD